MDNIIDKVLLEWSWRCEKGYPNLNNEKDLHILENIFQVNLKKQDLLEKKNNPDRSDVVQDTSKENSFYLKTDIDPTTGSPIPGAQEYMYFKGKGRSLSGYRLKGSEDNTDTEEVENEQEDSDKEYVKKILNSIIDPSIVEKVVTDSNFRTAKNIEEFQKDLSDPENSKYLSSFKDLFKYSAKRGGEGELIPFVSIEGAKLGISQDKDITDKQGKVLEVKVLDGKSFSLAQGGYVGESTFAERYQTFKKYLKPFQADEDNIFQFVFHDSSGFDKVPGGYLTQLMELLQDFPLNQNTLEKEYEVLKIGDKKYSVEKGKEYTLTLDKDGNLQPSEQAPRRLEDKQAALIKLLKHPWVTKESSPLQDLELLKSKGLEGIDLLLLFNKGNQGTPTILKLPKDKDRLSVYRISQGTLQLRYQ